MGGEGGGKEWGLVGDKAPPVTTPPIGAKLGMEINFHYVPVAIQTQQELTEHPTPPDNVNLWAFERMVYNSKDTKEEINFIAVQPDFKILHQENDWPQLIGQIAQHVHPWEPIN